MRGVRALIVLFPLALVTSLAFAEKQPINFSHVIHADQNETPCQFCHIYARRSYSSGVPPVSICVGCHGTMESKLIGADKPETDKIRQYWADQEPIPWVKIHDLPDHARFPHKLHIGASAERFRESAGAACDPKTDPRSVACRVSLFKEGGDTRCEACHGDVKGMAEVYQVDANFGKMGWCLECHLEVKGVENRKRAMSTLGGWFHAKEQDAVRETMIHLKNEKGYHNPNLTDCTTCHY